MGKNREQNSAAHKRNADNKEARAAYTRWCSGSESATATTDAAAARFPSSLSGGKRNSSKPRKY